MACDVNVGEQTLRRRANETNSGPSNAAIDPEVKASLLSKYFQSQLSTNNQILPDMQPRSAVITGPSSIISTPSSVSGIIIKLNARSADGPDK